MAVRKNRPDDAPQDFSFLSGIADTPSVSNESIPAEAGAAEDISAEPAQAEESPAKVTSSSTIPAGERPVERMPAETTRAESVLHDSTATDSVLDESTSEESMSEESMSEESMMDEIQPAETAPVTASPPPTFAAIEAGSIPQAEAALAESEAVMPRHTAPAPALKPVAASVSSSTAVRKPAAVPAASHSVAQRSPDAPATGRTENAGLLTGRLAEKLPAVVAGYAVVLTLLFLYFLFTGRFSTSGNHALESLPDIRPLPANEFRKYPDDMGLPDGHVMKLGESRRFGDLVLTPVRVTREPLEFQHFLSGKPDESLTTPPVLKLWLEIENVAADYGFPPFDAGLMSNRAPPHATDESAKVNSFLTVAVPSDGRPFTRVLNFLQTMDSNFVLTGQHSAKVIMPGETLNTFIACSEDIAAAKGTGDTEYTWRIQFRKGVNRRSGNGVTTLIDVTFRGSEISEKTAALTAPDLPVPG